MCVCVCLCCYFSEAVTWLFSSIYLVNSIVIPFHRCGLFHKAITLWSIVVKEYCSWGNFRVKKYLCKMFVSKIFVFYDNLIHVENILCV